MKKFLGFLFSVLLISSAAIAAPKSYTLSSPDASLRIEVKLADGISYSVYSGENLILKDCSLSLQLADETLGIAPKVKKA